MDFTKLIDTLPKDLKKARELNLKPSITTTGKTIVGGDIISKMVAQDLGVTKLTVDSFVELWFRHIFLQVKAGNIVMMRGLCDFSPNKIGGKKFIKLIDLNLADKAEKWLNDTEFVNHKESLRRRGITKLVKTAKPSKKV